MTWAKTPREVVKTAISALMNVTNHVGVVINRVNLAKHARYGYGDDRFQRRHRHGKRRAAHQRVDERYSWEAVTDAYEQLFAQMLRRPS